MNIYLRQSHTDENIMTQTALLQELRTGHALMMQCAAAAERLLAYDRPPRVGGAAPVSKEEAGGMAGLFVRLGEGLRARRPVAGPPARSRPRRGRAESGG